MKQQVVVDLAIHAIVNVLVSFLQKMANFWVHFLSLYNGINFKLMVATINFIIINMLC